MSVDMARANESHFGPPSEQISISKFLEDASTVELEPDLTSNPFWMGLSQAQRDAVDSECTDSISALKGTIENAWNNPILCAHLTRNHDASVAALYGQTDLSATKGKKRKRAAHGDSANHSQELSAMQDELDAISLNSWGLNLDSALFMRAPKNSDYNALESVKQMGNAVLFDHSKTHSTHARQNNPPTSPESPGSNPISTATLSVALITITVYTRLAWAYSFVSRSSQHVVLSSQTLAEFIHIIPCVSSDLPVETASEDGDVAAYELQNDTASNHNESCLVCIEDQVYSDNQSNPSYSDKLLSLIQKIPEKKRPQLSEAPTSLSETTFDSLTLRVNQPYWLLHQGNCEHFIVVDQIRLPHPSDLPSGYPLTVQITPPIIDLCQACTKVPAVYSVVGDIRLGESPYVMCAPCWRTMGPPKDDNVTVIPLVTHKQGWTEVEGR
ncbi:snRNA-activating protein of 50kDa MW C terminal-domain-containing protein [Hygrophoropsis aurantiaca]|uniref:snRNA-activating protein of 50kDa MW C terminal-domain-containing protein n=1 Tax=Hygrophoropsis aurantiaca TaxID=72124 RepID=A0ACB8ALW5_9AGAM|nr:snRNA-activating protein of 50kDa MW C terminal-domain-containing protein [Hygrophoropsis aurantiaca]